MCRSIEFQQDPHFGLEHFILGKEALAIRQKSLGFVKERKFNLSEMAEPEVSMFRFARFYAPPLLLAVGSAMLAWIMMWREIGPTALVTIPVVVAICFGSLVPRGFKPVEVLIFRTQSGQLLFRLYRPRKAAWEYEEFASILCQRIRDARSA